MKKSLFVQYMPFLAAMVTAIQTRLANGTTEQVYLYKQMLTEELSVDLKWASLSVNGTIVAADVVAMDSALPLKKRNALAAADGNIPKLGMKKQMSEKQLSDLDVLLSRRVENAVIVDKIFNDAVACTMGIHEKLEYIFLQGLSSGVALVEDTENVGTGIRVDYGYLASNKFGAVTAWSNPLAKPMDDIKRVTNAARAAGVNLRVMMMDSNTFDAFAMNAQVKQYFAMNLNFSGADIASPSLDQANLMLQGRNGLTIQIVDRSIITERDGIRTVHNPWEANKVVFVENATRIGRLMYGILAEETRKSEAATYLKAGSFILLKKWHSEEPFAEFTSGQALAVPVIDSVNGIFILDAEEADASVQTEGDANFAYKGTNYTRVSTIAAINKATGKATAKTADKDAKLAEHVNALSDEQILVFEANITAV